VKSLHPRTSGWLFSRSITIAGWGGQEDIRPNHEGTMFELINTAILNLDRADPLYEATSLTSKRQ